WTVCASGCNYTTIALAISNASTLTGDTIQLNANDSENLTLSGTKALTITEDGIRNRTLSSASGTTITINSSQTQNITIKNLVVTSAANIVAISSVAAAPVFTFDGCYFLGTSTSVG